MDITPIQIEVFDRSGEKVVVILQTKAKFINNQDFWKNIFKMADKNKDGKLVIKTEYKTYVYLSLKAYFSDDEVVKRMADKHEESYADLVKRADTNTDGKLSWEEI
jgi:Ca2+-binding EF-hand superfamily protein